MIQKENRMPNSALPDKLKGTLHWDYVWPLSRIPRSWTSYKWGKPKVFRGFCVDYENGVPKPIGQAESWQISYYPDAPLWAIPFAWYISYSGKVGSDGKFRNYRIGARYDNVDDYTTCTFIPFPSSRRYTGQAIEDTSTGS